MLRLQFQGQPWDLFLAIGYSVAFSSALLALGAGSLIAILLVLIVPGYVLVAALFPTGREIDWIERIALSFGLSIAIVPLLGLALNFTPFGVRFATIVGTVALFTIIVGWLAYLRRMRLPVSERLSMELELGLPNWRGDSSLDKAITVVLAGSVIVAGGVLLDVVVKPHPAVPFTEFSILGPSGDASGYPTRLNATQPGTVIIGVVNHEQASVDYTVRVDIVAVNLVYNATAGVNETIDGNRTTWSLFNISLASEQNWTRPYTFRINSPGLWKVQFLLFKEADFSSVYRELHLYVSVA